MRKALIPAAGRGTRFLPLTKSVPKELAPLVTTPALEYVVAEAAGHGVTDVLLVVSQGKAAVGEYFQRNLELEAVLEAKGDLAGLAAIRRAPSLATIHEVEQLTPRGLGDAVAHGEDFAAGEPIAVLLPDDLIDDRDHLLSAMIDVFAEHGGIVLGLIDVAREEISKYGCVSLVEGSDASGDVVAIADLVEKPPADTAPSTLAIIGRYILPPRIFEVLRATQPGSGGEVQLTDAMRTLAHEGVPVHGVVFRGRRYDTGDRLEYVKAVVQLAQRHPGIGEEFTAWLREYVSGS
ncbi:UTP--glucose-1-phosphate uridylyltransferase [Jatrophihabitans sp.]|uniref:UTP--glucose-1-phosphate uridylyltransferase n=1 Tax=Jatrophihabitans sp. TaxID=1932789 RepID=UPI0030C75954